MKIQWNFWRVLVVAAAAVFLTDIVYALTMTPYALAVALIALTVFFGARKIDDNV